MTSTEYMFDHAWQQERQRLASLEAQYDPGTIQHLEALGVDTGWRCLEVGAGGGSIATWLSERVGPGGRVVATDLNTRWLTALERPNLDVWQHDIIIDPLPEGEFDLVHTRTVLNHLGARAQVLDKLIAAVRPGGWLLVEEGDWVTWLPDPNADMAAQALFNKHWLAHDRFARQKGVDHAYGRRAYGDLKARGMLDVGAAGRVAVLQGGTPQAEMWRLSFVKLSEPTIAAGLLSEQEMGDVLALMANPDFAWMSMTVVAAWGRKPLPG